MKNIKTMFILVAAVVGIGICIITYINANTFTNREFLFEERNEDGEKVFESLVEVPVVKDGETGGNHPLNAKTGRRVTECLSVGDGFAVSHTLHTGEENSGLSAVEILSSYKEEIGDEDYYERFIYPRFSLLNNGAYEPIPQGVVNMGTYAYEDITAVNFDGHEIHLRAYVTRVNNGDYLLSCVMDAVDMGEFNAHNAYAQKERLCKIIEKQATKKF